MSADEFNRSVEFEYSLMRARQADTSCMGKQNVPYIPFRFRRATGVRISDKEENTGCHMHQNHS